MILQCLLPAGDGHKVFEDSDLPLNEANLIKINDYCEVVHDFDESKESQEGVYKVFAIGDSAALEGPDWRAKQGILLKLWQEM